MPWPSGLKRTKPDSLQPGPAALSPPQLAAVELLAAGKTDTDTAAAVGVTRQTVNEWKNRSPAFIAEVNRRRRELWEGTHDRLRGMATRALEVLEVALEGQIDTTALPAALHVLKALKIYGNVEAPAGPVTVEAVLLKEAEAEADRDFSGQPPTAEPVFEMLARDQERPRMVREAFLRLMAREELARRAAKRDLRQADTPSEGA